MATPEDVKILIPLYCSDCTKLSALEIADIAIFPNAVFRMVQSQEPEVPWREWYKRMASDALANILEPEE